MADNIAAWMRLRLRPHVLVDVVAVTTATSVLGAEVATPVLVAPTAFQRPAPPDGEVATARAAAAATVMVVSTMATVALEDVARAAPAGLRWFQLYVHRDCGLTAELVQRAAAAGYRALVLTVDVPVQAHRPREEAHGFGLPPGLEAANLGRRLDGDSGSALTGYVALEFDPAVTFADIERLAGLAPLPVVIKGVLRGDDAAWVVDSGAAGVIVSNHGGRQLDAAVAAADALAAVAGAVAGRAPGRGLRRRGHPAGHQCGESGGAGRPCGPGRPAGGVGAGGRRGNRGEVGAGRFHRRRGPQPGAVRGHVAPAVTAELLA